MGEELQQARNVFVILNPVAGTGDRDEVVAVLEGHFSGEGRRLKIYETSGAPDEDIPALVREAVAGGADLVIAAGGDGTVSTVAGALVGSTVPLGVLPIGTANVFAQVLGLPLDLNGAVELLADSFATAPIDGMRLNDELGVLHISVGITSLMQRDTPREAKRRYGRLAYLYVAARWLFGFQPQRFNLVIDGTRYRLRASQVLIANGGEMGQPPFTWGPDIAPDDGVLDVCVINASSFRDYLVVGWSTLTGRHRKNPRLRYFKARRSISVNSKVSLPVQRDGELAGKTPVLVEVVPGAFRCAVTPEYAARRAGGEAQTKEIPARARAVGNPAVPVSPEEAAAAAPVTATLRTKLSQIEAPEQAREVVDELIRQAGDAKAVEVRPAHEDESPAKAVQDEARKPGPSGVASTIVETAAQVSAAEGETQEAIAQAAQRATNPELLGVEESELSGPLALLREEILHRMRPYQAVDARLFLAVNGLPHPHWANEVMYALTAVMNGGLGWALALLMITALDRRRGSRALRQVLPPLWIATMIVEYPVKHYFRRRRPFIQLVQAISVGRKPGTYSFPSGHSAAAFAGAWLLTRHFPALSPLWYTVAVLTGFSRIYLGAHYPGDVLSGALTGTLLAEGARIAIDLADEDWPGIGK